MMSSLIVGLGAEIDDSDPIKVIVINCDCYY